MTLKFFASLFLILALDFLWLGFIVKDFNLQQLRYIARIENGAFQLLPVPAVLAYLLMALSVVLFSLPQAANANSGLEAFFWGAMLGLVVYGIFDFTNLAVLKDYPLAFAACDLAWGTFLYGFVTWTIGWIAKGRL